MPSIPPLILHVSQKAIKSYIEGEKILKELEKQEKDIKKGEGGGKSQNYKETQIEKAFNSFAAACTEHAEFAMAYFKRGYCYMMLNDYKRALYDFSAAILNASKSEND